MKHKNEKTDRNRERIEDLFCSLCRLDSISYRESEMIKRLEAELTALGFETSTDSFTGPDGEECGNLYGYLKGTRSGAPVLFSAHMDTVAPGLGKKPCRKGERIMSDGSTVLGADDVCGIVEILEGVRLAREDPAGYGDVEVLFTAAEEVYCQGARKFDFSRIRSKEAYVLDMSGPPGSAAGRAPSIVAFDVRIKGRAAHAGFAPEDGINALQAAARAIDRIPQGHVSGSTTLNIGMLQAGSGRNIVPEDCCLSGEVRSFDHEEALETVKHAEEIFRKEAERIGAEPAFAQTVHIKAYEMPGDAEVCRRFQAACEEIGLPGKLTETKGGSDNNILAEKGISGIVLSCGMYRSHSTAEYTTISDLETGARLVAAIIGTGREEHKDEIT